MSELDYDFIYIKYWLEDPGWSMIDLAKHYNTYITKIRKFMVKNEIPRRNYHESLLNRHACKWKKKAFDDVMKSISYREKLSKAKMGERNPKWKYATEEERRDAHNRNARAYYEKNKKRILEVQKVRYEKLKKQRGNK